MAVDIGPKIGIDGEAQFRKQLTDINQALKTMGAEQKAVASAFQDEADAEKKLAAQKEVLSRQIAAQQEKLALLEKGLRESAAMYGEADSKTMKWQQAVHEATAQLNNMNGQLNGMGGTIEDTAEALGDAEEATSGWAEVMKDQLVGDAIKAGLSKVYDLVKSIGGAMWDASKAGAAYADDVLTMATVSGMNVEQLQEYKYMADLVDVSVDTITGSMTKLTSAMAKAQKGNEETEQAFKELGVAIQDENGKLRDNQDVFNDVIQALGRIDNETEREAKAMQLMGKSAKDLNPLIAAGADKLQDLAKEARDTGYVLSGSALDALGKQQDAMDRLDKKTEALKNRFAVGLAPSMEKAYGLMGEALDNPRVQRGLDVLAQGVGSVIGGVTKLAADALPGLMSILAPLDGRLMNLTDEELKIVQAADQIGAAHTEMVNGFKGDAKSIVDETQRIEGLWKELQNLVDENGNVKKADEERVNYITGQLQEALGIQMELENGILQGYKDQQAEIDNLIKKREAEALMAAGAERFAEAQARANEQLQAAAKLEPKIAEARQQFAEAQEALNKAQEEASRIYGDDEFGINMRTAVLQEYSNELEKARGHMEQVEKEYKDLHDSAVEMYADVDRWQRAQTAAANGNYKEVVRILTSEFSVTLDYYKEKKKLNDQEKKDLKDRIKDAELTIKEYKKNLEAGLSGFSEAGLKEMEGYVAEAKRILDGKAVAGHYLDGLIAGLLSPDRIKAIAQASAKVAKTIDQNARSTLEIKSPSRKAKYIGEMWDKGMIEGLEAHEKELAKAATSLADTVSTSATPGSKLEYGYGNALTAAGAGSGGMGGTSSYTTNMGGITVRVDGAGAVNADDLAQRVAVQLTRQLQRANRAR